MHEYCSANFVWASVLCSSCSRVLKVVQVSFGREDVWDVTSGGKEDKKASAVVAAAKSSLARP
jgi:hypothetical protein